MESRGVRGVEGEPSHHLALPPYPGATLPRRTRTSLLSYLLTRVLMRRSRVSWRSRSSSCTISSRHFSAFNTPYTLAARRYNASTCPRSE